MGVNKSAGMVHGKWGAASFTSLRTVNGTGLGNAHSISQPSKAATDSVASVAKKREWNAAIAEPPQPASIATANLYAAPRPKKFFKSRDTLTQQSQPQLPHANVSTNPSPDLQPTIKSAQSNGNEH